MDAVIGVSAGILKDMNHPIKKVIFNEIVINAFEVFSIHVANYFFLVMHN